MKNFHKYMDEFLAEFDIDLIQDGQERAQQIENDKYMMELEELRLKSLVPDPNVFEKRRKMQEIDELSH